MVNVDQIEQLLEKHFWITGKVQIDPQTGVVDVRGDVELRSKRKVTQLPVNFGDVTGLFDCSYNNLESLQGAPTSVGGSFFCSDNQLTSLEGAPTTVRGFFFCNFNQLTSLQGAPTTVGGTFDCSSNPKLETLEGVPTSVGGTVSIQYGPQLRLLRLLTYDQFEIMSAPDVVRDIMNKYAGGGKRVMLHCALELKKAGYDGNAKW